MTLTGDYAPSAADWVRMQVELYEATDGAEGNTIRGLPIVVVTSRGHRSGKLRKNPVMRVEHEGVYAAVASAGGQPEHPTWFHNLLAEPLVDLQDGPEVRPYRARLVSGDERTVWWERAVAAYPPYADYQTRTDREIPVFVLEPA